MGIARVLAAAVAIMVAITGNSNSAAVAASCGVCVWWFYE